MNPPRHGLRLGERPGVSSSVAALLRLRRSGASSTSAAVRRQPRVAKALAVAQGYARFAGAVARRA